MYKCKASASQAESLRDGYRENRVNSTESGRQQYTRTPVKTIIEPFRVKVAAPLHMRVSYNRTTTFQTHIMHAVNSASADSTLTAVRWPGG